MARSLFQDVLSKSLERDQEWEMLELAIVWGISRFGIAIDNAEPN